MIEMNCPNCKNIILEPRKSNPPGALVCPMCGKGWIPTEIRSNPTKPTRTGGRHYKPSERQRIMKTKEFKKWWKERWHDSHGGMPQRWPGDSGKFHAFMTDVGKFASRKGKKGWPDATWLSDKARSDVTQVRKYLHEIGEGKRTIGGQKAKRNPNMLVEWDEIEEEIVYGFLEENPGNWDDNPVPEVKKVEKHIRNWLKLMGQKKYKEAEEINVKKIKPVLGKGVLPYAPSKKEIKDPKKFLKLVSCIYQVGKRSELAGEGPVSPYGVCRASVMKNPKCTLEDVKSRLDTLDLKDVTYFQDKAEIDNGKAERRFSSQTLLETRRGVEDDDFPELTKKGKEILNERLAKHFKGMPVTYSFYEGEKGDFFIIVELVKKNPPSKEDWEDAIAGEGWAIQDYTNMLDGATPEERKVLEHIIEEEKEHLEELLMLKHCKLNPGKAYEYLNPKPTGYGEDPQAYWVTVLVHPNGEHTLVQDWEGKIVVRGSKKGAMAVGKSMQDDVKMAGGQVSGKIVPVRLWDVGQDFGAEGHEISYRPNPEGGGDESFRENGAEGSVRNSVQGGSEQNA